MSWLFKYIFQVVRKLFSLKWIKLPWIDMIRSSGEVPFTVSKKVLEAYCLFIIPSQLGYLALIAIEQATLRYDFLRMSIFEVAVVVASALADIIIAIALLRWTKTTKRLRLSGIIYKLVLISATITAFGMCTSVLSFLATIIAAPFSSFMYLYDAIISMIAVALCMQGILEFAAHVSGGTGDFLALWVIKPTIAKEDNTVSEDTSPKFDDADVVPSLPDIAQISDEKASNPSSNQKESTPEPVIESVIIMPETEQEPQGGVQTQATESCIYVGTGVKPCDPSEK